MNEQQFQLMLTVLMLIELAEPQDDRIWQAHAILQGAFLYPTAESMRKALEVAAAVNAEMAIQTAQAR